MNIEDTLNQLYRDKVDVNIYVEHYSYSDESRWCVRLSKDTSDIQLRIVANDAELPIALAEAYNKWRKSIGQGIPAMNPALEYKPRD